MNNNNWGTTLLGAILLLILAGGLYTWHSLRESARLTSLADEAARASAEDIQAERDLRTFAETHLSDLQLLIDEIQGEIDVRKRKLDLLAAEMRRVHVAPETDPDYKAWNEAVSRLRSKLGDLRKIRRDTFVASKKFDLNPGGKVELNGQFEERLNLARAQAEQTRAQFNEMRNTNAPPEPATFVPTKKEPEKPKVPPKKRWWIF